jgi:hypothetical protein
MNSNEVIIYIEQLKNNLIADELEYIPKNIKDEILQYQQLNDFIARVRGTLALIEIAKYLGMTWNWDSFYFVKGEKPSSPLFEFSTSYVGNLVCIAASQNLQVGIDIEIYDEKTEYTFIQDYLHPNEINRLHSNLNSKELLKIWTKKEAYLKLIGKGISENLMLIDTTKSQNAQCIFTEINIDENQVISLATFEDCSCKIIRK